MNYVLGRDNRVNNPMGNIINLIENAVDILLIDAWKIHLDRYNIFKLCDYLNFLVVLVLLWKSIIWHKLFSFITAKDISIFPKNEE